LEVLAGKHMVSRDAVRILGRPAFYDLMLVTSGELGYLGNQWRRSVACAGSSLTLQACIGALPSYRTQLQWLMYSTCRDQRDGSAGDVTAHGVQGDISAETMISGVEGVDPVRRQMLIDMLDIDLSWWAAYRGLLMRLTWCGTPRSPACSWYGIGG
jgi:CCR4-NOT complex subunit CAF16